MTANLKPYPAYKPSGVEWLDDVPAHWEVLPNRAIFAEVNERNHPDEQMLSVTITKGVIHQRALLEDSSKKDASRLDRSDYKLVRLGDLAYNKMRAWQGAIGASEYHGIVSPAYVVHRPRNGANSRYLHYLLRTPAFARGRALVVWHHFGHVESATRAFQDDLCVRPSPPRTTPHHHFPRSKNRRD